MKCEKEPFELPSILRGCPAAAVVNNSRVDFLLWCGKDDIIVMMMMQFPLSLNSPFHFSLSLLWSDLTDWHWEERRGKGGWLGSFLALGIFLTIMNPLSEGVWFSLIDSLCSPTRSPDHISYLFRISDAFILFLSSSHADLQFAS